MTTANRMPVEEYRRLMGVGTPAPSEKPKRNKFGAEPQVVNGERFDSKLEAKRFAVLQQREASGLISELQRQVPFALTVNSYLVGSYVADAVYFDNQARKTVVEDCKGGKATVTQLFQWKKRHMRAEHRIEITIIERADQ